VLGTYGDGAQALLEDGVSFTLEQPGVLTAEAIGAGGRALLLLDAEAIGVQARRLDADGDLDCDFASALPVEEVASLALSEDCQAEANADVGECDDTVESGACSISGAGPSVSLCLLALLGLLRRQES